jgi:hypothetical protein
MSQTQHEQVQEKLLPMALNCLRTRPKDPSSVAEVVSSLAAEGNTWPAVRLLFGVYRSTQLTGGGKALGLFLLLEKEENAAVLAAVARAHVWRHWEEDAAEAALLMGVGLVVEVYPGEWLVIDKDPVLKALAA